MAGLRTEKPSNETINETETPQTEAPQTEAPPFIPPVVQEPVAAPPSTFVGAQQTYISLIDLENKWDAEEVSSFPRIKVSSGTINGDGTNYGEFLDIQVLSFHKRWFLTSGKDQTDLKTGKVTRLPEAVTNALCRPSYDGVKFRDKVTGQYILNEDYLNMLKEDEFVDAKSSDYVDLICLIINADKNKEAGIKKGFVQVTISVTGINDWRNYTKQTKLGVMRGSIPIDKQTCVRAKALQAVSKKTGGDYARLTFEAVPLDIINDYKVMSI